MGDKERKKWAIDKAKEILELRDDVETLKLYEKKKREKGVKSLKLDDISDTIIQLQAFKYTAFVSERE